MIFTFTEFGVTLISGGYFPSLIRVLLRISRFSASATVIPCVCDDLK